MAWKPAAGLLVAWLAAGAAFTSTAGAATAAGRTCSADRVATAEGCETPGAVSRRLGRIVARAERDYGLQAVIARVDVGRRTLYRAARGRSQADVPADTAMHFRIGSMAIPWLTTLMLQLQQEGRLSFDDKLSRFLPDVPRADRVTLRMLATNTSGYYDYLQGNQAFIDRFHSDVFKRWNPSELLDIALARGFVCDPGTCFSYAHTNYILLGDVVEKVTGQSVAAQMTRRILRPLGLDETRISSKATIPDPVLHAFTSERGVYEDSTTWSPSWTIGEGMIVTSTLDDIATAGRAIFSGRLLSAGSYRQLVATPAVPPNTRAVHYGLGLLVSNDWRIQNPSLNGYSGVLAHLPARGLTVALTVTSTRRGSTIDRNANEALFARLAAYLAPGNPTPYAAQATVRGTAAGVPAGPGDFAGSVRLPSGRRVYLECRGSGGPIVVLEAGLRSRSDFWKERTEETKGTTVFPGVARFTRVCIYDRPGTTLGTTEFSRSDPVPMPRTARDAARDLRALLRAAKLRGPFVLAGHSTGGLIVRLYASMYPRDVVALVLVDALSEFLEGPLDREQVAAYDELNNGPLPGLEDYADLEQVLFRPSFGQMRRRAGQRPLPAIPVTVVSRALPFELPPGLPAGLTTQVVERAWAASQEQLGRVVPGTRRVVATRSSHYIMFSEPALLIREIRRVVAQVRRGS